MNKFVVSCVVLGIGLIIILVGINTTVFAPAEHTCKKEEPLPYVIVEQEGMQCKVIIHEKYAGNHTPTVCIPCKDATEKCVNF